jgi:hypothetical protein
MQLAAVAAAIVAGPAIAADAGTTTSQMQTTPSAAGSVQGYIPPGASSVGGSERIDNSNPVPLDTWMQNYAAEHGGHLPRMIYIDQMGHTWDVVDAQRRGHLIPEDARVVYLTPGDTQVIYVVPGAARVIYLPQDTAPPGPGGLQATPGANGPSSPKGE